MKSKIVSKTACPQCRSNGADSKGDNLGVYDDGHKYCHSCRYYAKGDNALDNRNYQRPQESVGVYQALPFHELQHKPIRKDVAEFYGVRVSVKEEDGQTQDSVYYPYFNIDGNLQAWKIRKVPKEFRWAGSADQVQLFGQKIFPKGKMLLLVEGEDDALASFQMFSNLGKRYSVVSISAGAGSDGTVKNDIRNNLEYFSGFNTVVICFDNDVVGSNYSRAVADLLVGQIAQVKLMSLPEGFKDASDMLIAGKQEEFMKCLWNSKDYSPEMIVRGQDIDFDSLRKPKTPGFSLPYPELDNKLHGIRKGELTLLSAGSGIGKSTFAREMAYHLVKEHNCTVANIYLETPMEDAASSFIAMDNGVSPARYWFNPTLVDDENARRSYDELIHNNKLHFFKHFGSIQTEKLLGKFYYFAKVLGSDFIVLDHISMCISGEDSGNERKDIDVLMTNLAAFCVETGVGVIAVVHLKRVHGKNYNVGDEVELVDLRGSGGLEQMSWNVIALERDQQGEEKNFSKVRLLKNRTWGFTGGCDTLIYDHETGRLKSFKVEPEYQ